MASKSAANAEEVPATVQEVEEKEESQPQPGELDVPLQKEAFNLEKEIGAAVDAGGSLDAAPSGQPLLGVAQEEQPKEDDADNADALEDDEDAMDEGHDPDAAGSEALVPRDLGGARLPGGEDLSGITSSSNVAGGRVSTQKDTVPCRTCSIVVEVADAVKEGSEKYPAWSCRLCHNVTRNIVRGNGQEAQLAKDLRERSKVEFKNMVRDVVDKLRGQSSGSRGLTNEEKRALIGKVVASWSRVDFISHENEDLYLNELQFKTHMAAQRPKLTDEQIDELWRVESAEGSPRRHVGKDGKIKVVVEGIERVRNGTTLNQEHRIRELKKAVSDPQKVAQERAAMGTLVTPELQRLPGMGEVRKGLSLTVADVKARKKGNNKSKHFFDELVAAPDTIKEVFPDPDTGASMVACRTALNSFLTQAKQRLQGSKQAPLVRLQALGDAMGWDHADIIALNVKEHLEEHVANIKHIETLASGVAGWTNENYKANYLKFLEFADKVARGVPPGQQMMRDLADARSLKRKADSGAAKAANLAARRAFGNPKKTQIPGALCNFIINQLMFKYGGKTGKEIVGWDHPNSPEGQALVSLGAPQVTVLQGDQKAEIEDFLNSFQPRLDAMVRKVEVFVEDAKGKEALGRLSGDHPGHPLVPSVHKGDFEMLGAQTLTMPFAFGSAVAVLRSGPEIFPLSSSSGYLKITKGPAVLVSWDVHVNEVVGRRMTDQMDLMLESLSQKQLNTLAQNGKMCTAWLPTGAIAHIGPGMLAGLVSMTPPGEAKAAGSAVWIPTPTKGALTALSPAARRCVLADWKHAGFQNSIHGRELQATLSRLEASVAMLP